MAEHKLVIPSKKYKGDTAVVSARLPNSMIREIDRIAEQTGHNRNEIFMLCMEFALENLDEGNGEA